MDQMITYNVKGIDEPTELSPNSAVVLQRAACPIRNVRETKLVTSW